MVREAGKTSMRRDAGIVPARPGGGGGGGGGGGVVYLFFFFFFFIYIGKKG